MSFDPEELRVGAAYEAARGGARAAAIELRRRRRVDLGDLISVVFESRDTLAAAAEEALRAERVEDPGGSAARPAGSRRCCPPRGGWPPASSSRSPTPRRWPPRSPSSTASPGASTWRSTAAAARRCRLAREGRRGGGAGRLPPLRAHPEPARGLDRGSAGPAPRRPPALLGEHRAERRAARRHRRRPDSRVVRAATVRRSRRRSPPPPPQGRSRLLRPTAAAAMAVMSSPAAAAPRPPPPWRSGHPDPASLSLLDPAQSGSCAAAAPIPAEAPAAISFQGQEYVQQGRTTSPASTRGAVEIDHTGDWSFWVPGSVTT